MSKSLYNLSQSRSNIYNDQYSIKIAGAAPRATPFYIANSSGTSYSRANNENKNLVICVNQLGGIGRHRSQFRANADGNRGTFCIKPLLSVFNYYPNYIETGGPRSGLAIYVNKLNTEQLVNLVSDFSFIQREIPDGTGYELSGNNLNINFGGAPLDMYSNTVFGYEHIPNTNLGAFVIILEEFGKTFNDETYKYLVGLKSINTFNDESQGNGIYNLLSGYNFTITNKSKPDKSLTFSSLTNENYYYLLKNNNWTNF